MTWFIDFSKFAFYVVNYKSYNLIKSINVFLYSITLGGFGYNWCVESLYWQDFIKPNPIKSITCKSTQDDVPFRFQVFARYKKNDPIVK